MRTFISVTAATFALGSRLFCHHRENSLCVSRPLSWEGSGKPRSETGREGNGAVVRLTSGDRRRRQPRVENATSTIYVCTYHYVCACAIPARLIHLHAPSVPGGKKRKPATERATLPMAPAFVGLHVCMYIVYILHRSRAATAAGAIQQRRTAARVCTTPQHEEGHETKLADLTVFEKNILIHLL